MLKTTMVALLATVAIGYAAFNLAAQVSAEEGNEIPGGCVECPDNPPDGGDNPSTSEPPPPSSSLPPPPSSEPPDEDDPPPGGGNPPPPGGNPPPPGGNPPPPEDGLPPPEVLAAEQVCNAGLGQLRKVTEAQVIAFSSDKGVLVIGVCERTTAIKKLARIDDSQALQVQDEIAANAALSGPLSQEGYDAEDVVGVIIGELGATLYVHKGA